LVSHLIPDIDFDQGMKAERVVESGELPPTKLSHL
jgi:hypothetical protein